jgi:polyferredoxin
MIVYRTSDSEQKTKVASSLNGKSNGTNTPNAESVSPGELAAAKALSKQTTKKLSKPLKSDPRKFRWSKKHFALQQGKIRTSGWRLGTQIFFTILCVVLGWQFISFVDATYQVSTDPLPYRPPGVEGFLPISGLMGALDWINQGTLNNIHPAATVLFLLFMVLAFIFRKSFCGWICPAGLFSESLARLGRWIFGRNFHPPAWLDFILRGFKYFILGFFAWAIFTMGAEALNAFITSPYNKVSDIKMLEFFRELSKTGAIIVLILAAGSVMVNGFWCRYLCPYGALMGIVSWFSPVKVRRNDETCIDCKLCDVACPAKLIVSKRAAITKVECIGCNDCVSSCPVPDTLWMGTKKHVIRPRTIAIGIVIALIGVTTSARMFGMWENDLTDEEVRMHVARMNSSDYGHPGR